tara:strand:- start:134 stop:1333 length:1200 start_codon:yes stop_codon:yes gene_type:complete
MANETLYSETTTREEPYLEAMRRGLLQDVRGLQANRFGYNLVDQTDPETGEVLRDEFGYPLQDYKKIMGDDGQWVGPAYEPDFQVADLTPEQRQASAQAQAGLGSFMPSLRGGIANVQGGQQYLRDARTLADTRRDDPYGFQQRAATGLDASVGGFQPGTLADPDSNISAFYNPYEQQVVDIVKSDFDRARRISDQQVAGQAVGAGAFGGSRAAVAEQEARKNLTDQELKALSNLRASGYQNALSAGSESFENQQRRQAQAGQMMGNLGSTYGQLGQRDVELMSTLGKGLGSLGTSEANLGTMMAGQNRADVSMLGNLGAIARGVDQDVLDAVYKTNLARQRMPYQEYSYFGDTLSGIPSQTSSMTASQAPQASAAQTAMGYGLGGLSALAGFNQLAPG